MNKKIIIKILKLIRGLIIFGLVFIIIMPYVKILIDAIKSNADMNDNLVVWVVTNPNFTRLNRIFKQLVVDKAYFNTILLATITALIQVFVTSIFGYSFAKLKFKGSNLFFCLIMISIIIPKEALYNSRILLFTNYHFFGIDLFKSVFSIYLMTIFGMGIYSIFFIYLYRQQFRIINNELAEQANIDGAGVFKTFFKIMLPSARGTTIVVFLMTFILTYNDYYYPLFFKYASNGYIVISNKIINHRYANTSVTALCMMFPLLVLYMIVQKVFIDSIEKTVIV